MKKRIITAITSIFLLSAGMVTGQGVPDNDAILRAIINSDSPYYYPGLMMRYQAGDTTLTLDDYHYLYYGYAYQESYKPLEPVSGETQVLMQLERYPEPTPEQAAELLEYTKVVMAADPFSPKNINFMAFAYNMMGDEKNAAINFDRLNKILSTIESSGTGLKESTPWHVLWYTHANDVLAAKGLDIHKRQIRSRSVEYISLTRRDGNVKGYFFDFGRMYWKRPENIPQRENRVDGFEINGIKVKGRNSHYSPPQ